MRFSDWLPRFALAFALVCGTARAAETREADVGFESALSQFTDINLQGVNAAHHLSFTRPAQWQLLADPVLRLRFDHSAALLTDRSHLTVRVNDQSVGTVRLDAGNVVGGDASFTIPRRLLADYNDLELAVEQHYSPGCEDPFDPALWTRIGNDSSIRFQYAPKPAVTELLKWPLPIFDKLGYGPVRLTLASTAPPSSASARAAGTLALAVGRIVAYRGVDMDPPITDVSQAAAHAILVGLPSEEPLVGALLGPLDLRPDQGLVALVPNPADPTLVVLVVTGGGPEGIGRAAAALTGQDRYPVLSGDRSTVDALTPSIPPPPTQSPDPAPHESSFTLADLDIAGQTLRGYYSSTFGIPLRLEGDARARAAGGTFTLEYAYSALLDQRLSTVEVRLGGLVLRSVGLSKPEGEARAVLEVPLPPDLVTQKSQIDVVFHLFPRDFDACEHISDRHLWATVFASSRIDVPRDRAAVMPDLSLLRYDLWPFSLEEDGGAVVAVLPDDPEPEAMSAGFDLAAALGHISPTERPGFRLDTADTATFADNPLAHFVLLVDATRHALYDALLTSGKLSLVGGPDRKLRGAAASGLLDAVVGTPYGTIEELLQPSNDRRAVLVLRAERPEGLPVLVETVTDPSRVDRLSGNVAVVDADGDVRTMNVAERVPWGTLQPAANAQVRLRRNWPLLGAALLSGAFGIAALARFWSRSRRGSA